MSYMPSLAWQTSGFIYSAGLGFCLGLVYDFFRIIFYLLTGSDKKYILARDIIFMFVLLWSDFLFLLVMCSGRLMLYAFAGECLGLMIYFYSLSGLIYGSVRGMLRRIRRDFSSISDFIRVKTAMFQPNIREKLKKSKKIFKKLLQIRHYL